MILTFANLKGGSGKTTSAMNAAHAIVARGRRPLYIDTDTHRSAARWFERARGAGQPLPFDMEWFPSEDLLERIDGWVADYDDLVIDSDSRNARVMQSAIATADLVVIPANGSPDDWEQAVKSAKDCQVLGIKCAVLLNRIKTSETSTVTVGRQMLGDAGVAVFSTVVPDLVEFRMAYGAPIENMREYGDVLTEVERELSNV